MVTSGGNQLLTGSLSFFLVRGTVLYIHSLPPQLKYLFVEVLEQSGPCYFHNASESALGSTLPLDLWLPMLLETSLHEEQKCLLSSSLLLAV